MAKPLAIKGWFRIENPSGISSALPKAIYVEDWSNKMVVLLLSEGYSFTPVHVFTQEELKSYINGEESQ